jgi:hypothetical protein
MPDLGPLGRGGARRRTRRRMMAVNEMQNSKSQSETNEGSEIIEQPETIIGQDSSEKLAKLARLLKDKGVITETEYNLIFE